MPNLTNKQKGGALLAAMVAVATPIYVFWEGEETVAYQDVIGVWTICSGDTRNVRPGMKLAKAECRMRTARILEEFGEDVAKVNPTIINFKYQWASHTIFAANVGMGNYNKSSVLKEDLAGNHRLGCRAIQRYKYAGGRVFQGLVNRRNGVVQMVGEYELCLADAIERDIEGK